MYLNGLQLLILWYLRVIKSLIITNVSQTVGESIMIQEWPGLTLTSLTPGFYQCPLFLLIITRNGPEQQLGEVVVTVALF